MSINYVDLQVLQLIKPILQEDTDSSRPNRKESHDTTDSVAKYKTERCRYWSMTGECPFGKTCAFAHGNLQIRQKIHTSRNYKTKLCNNFSTTGACKYGERCQFRHQMKCAMKMKTPIRHDSFSKILGELSDLQLSVTAPKRLKIFEEFELDTFDTVDWKYKKPRTYTM